MSTTRNRNLLIIIGVLLLTNIAVLAYFLTPKKASGAAQSEQRDRSGVADQLQKEVGFNDEQLAQYKLLKEKQRQTLKPMFDDMRKAKDSLFRLLSFEVSDSVMNNAANVIAQKQKALDLQTLTYFKQVRALCTPEQQPKYDSLILRMFKKMGKRGSEAEKKEKK